MHVIAWLLTQRAVAAGELPPRDALHPSRRLGAAPVSDGDAVSGMPAAAGQLVAASDDLYRRVARLDAAQSDAASPASPARRMLDRLNAAFYRASDPFEFYPLAWKRHRPTPTPGHPRSEEQTSELKSLI